MGVQPVGQGSPAQGDREAAVGVTILSDRSAAQGRRNGGAPPSLTRRLRAHHAGHSVSQASFLPLRRNDTGRFRLALYSAVLSPCDAAPKSMKSRAAPQLPLRSRMVRGGAKHVKQCPEPQRSPQSVLG